jgi:hypothetical protein
VGFHKWLVGVIIYSQLVIGKLREHAIFLNSDRLKGIVGASSDVLGKNKAFLKLKYLL